MQQPEISIHPLIGRLLYNHLLLSAADSKFFYSKMNKSGFQKNTHHKNVMGISIHYTCIDKSSIFFSIKSLFIF